MMTRTTTRSKGASSPVMDFLKKYGLIIVGLLVGFPYLLRFYKDQQTLDTINNLEESDKVLAAQNVNPTISQMGLDKITSRLDLQNIARNVAYHLGTSIQTKNASWVSWLNPRGWSENDEKAFQQLKLINYATSLDLVVKCYYFLTQRNLLTDVRTLLDEEYKKQLPLFK
jgi:hypothetical protein